MIYKHCMNSIFVNIKRQRNGNRKFFLIKGLLNTIRTKKLFTYLIKKICKYVRYEFINLTFITLSISFLNIG